MCCRRCSLFVITALCAAIAGCGGGEEVARVSGEVTLDAQPLTGAQIVFEDAAHGVSVNVPLAANGAYTARTFDKEGLPPGTYQVAVRPGSFGSGEAPLVSEGRGYEPPASNIPERYRSPATSGLSATVVAGENPPQNFSLTTQR